MKGDKEAFRNWLCDAAGFQNKSAGDVVSRLKRAEMFVDVDNDNCDDDELIFKMCRDSAFKALSINVQSQLKRAVRLYRQFLSQH